MAKTISTHCGGEGKVSQAHNRRDKKAVKKFHIKEGDDIKYYDPKTDLHIDPALSIYNEYLIDEPAREAYKRIFGKSLEAYNQRQIDKQRPERQIPDYYNHILKDKKKNVVYEMIIQVGDYKDTGIKPEETETERAILKEFIATWTVRNPHLELIGVYIHADELHGTLHAHLNYIPVATGYKNGLSVQNGLNKALAAQGFADNKGRKNPPQMRWTNSENKALEAICNKYGIEVHHPMAGRGEKHKETAEYKRNQRLKEENAALETKKANLDREISDKRAEALRIESDATQNAARIIEIAHLKAEKEIEEEKHRAYNDAYNDVYKEYRHDIINMLNSDTHEEIVEEVRAYHTAEALAENERLKAESAEIEADIARGKDLKKLMREDINNMKTTHTNLRDDILKLAKGKKEVEEFIKSLDLPEERNFESKATPVNPNRTR